MDNLPLVLYFPYPSVGGVSTLFLRIAKLFSESQRVILMDYIDGYMAKNLPLGVEFLEYDKKEHIPSNSIIIFQGVYPWRIKDFNLFPSTCRVLFWHLHPENFLPYQRLLSDKKSNFITRIFSILKKRAGKKLVNSLLLNKSLFFMDLPNRRKTCNYFGLNKVEDEYLRIFSADLDSKNKKVLKALNKDFLNFGWMGRIEDFKTPILLHTLNRLSRVKGIQFDFTVIGKGIDTCKLENFRQRCTNYQIKIVEEVHPSEITSHLSRFDILFAMGTSALEGAKIGKPTILLDYSFEKINRLYRFELIYEKKGFSLGESITKLHFEEVCSLEKKIFSILDNYSKVSSECQNYWRKNFSSEVFISSFSNAISKSSMQIKDLLYLNFHKPDLQTKIIYKLKNVPPSVAGPAWQY